jgi:hypothetical protein
MDRVKDRRAGLHRKPLGSGGCHPRQAPETDTPEPRRAAAAAEDPRKLAALKELGLA